MFVIRTAFKYVFSKSKGQRTSSIMIILGIAAGLAALIVISAVMNGLQTTQTDRLRNLESYDMIIKSDILTAADIEALDGVDTAFDFAETAVLISDTSSGKSMSARVRAFSPDVLSHPRFSKDLRITGTTEQLAVSYTIMNSLDMLPQDELEVTFLRRGKTATVVPYMEKINISGMYGSTLAEFSANTLITDLDCLSYILGSQDTSLGVFIFGNERGVIEKVKELDPTAEILTWKEYNKAVYSALVLEKTMMRVFLAFVFLLICVSLKNSTNRLLANRQKEGAMLRALGCTRRRVNAVFLIQGLIICLAGELAGTVLGLAVVANIQNILILADRLAGVLFNRSTVLASLPFSAWISASEVLLSCTGIFILALVFTAAGCRRIYRSEIMEVIFNASD